MGPGPMPQPDLRVTSVTIGSSQPRRLARPITGPLGGGRRRAQGLAATGTALDQPLWAAIGAQAR